MEGKRKKTLQLPKEAMPQLLDGGPEDHLVLTKNQLDLDLGQGVQNVIK